MRAVRCPFCYVCLDVSHIPVGRFIECPACSGPIRVPQPNRRGPLLSGASGLVVGLAFGVVATLVLLQFRRTGSEDAARTAPPAAAKSQPEQPKPQAQPPQSLHVGRVWEVEVERLTRQLDREFAGIHLLPRWPWLVAVEPGDYDASRVIEIYERALQSLKAAFDAEFQGVRMLEIRTPQVALVLRNRGAFDTYWRRHFGRTPPRNVTGIYHVTMGRTVTYHDAHMPLDSLLHEGTHQLVRAVSYASPGTFWIHEGLGNLFETYRRVDRAGYESIECVPDVNTSRLYTILAATDQGRLTASELREFLGLSMSGFYVWYEQRMKDQTELRESLTEEYYGVSWALAYFMLKGGHEGYRRTFLACMGKELDGRLPDFEAVLREESGASLEEFERDLRAFISDLR